MTRVLFAIAVVFGSECLARAEEPALPVVEVIAAGDAAVLEAMADRIGSIESRFRVAIRWAEAAAIDARAIVARRAEGAELPFARVWLDLRDPRRAVLFIANAGHDRFLVRVVPVSFGYGELTRESLATIAESAIDAMLAGGQIGVDRSAAMRELEAQTGQPIATAPPVPAPAVRVAEPVAVVREAPTEPSAPPANSPAWSAAVQYRGDAIAEGPELRHGVQLALAHASPSDGALGLLLIAQAHYAPGFSLGPDGRGIDAQGGGVRVAAGVGSGSSRAFFWQAALGAGVDLFRVAPRIASDSGLAGARPFVVTTPIATALVSGAIHAAPFVDLILGVGLDLAIVAPDYDVAEGSVRTTVISPFRAHPYVCAGVGIPFASGSSP